MLCIFDMHYPRENALLVVISATNRDPLYKQVTDQLRDAIAKGSIVSEGRLPSIREMANELKVSPITIKRAYGDLERDGYVITRPGMGTFVAGIDREKLRQEKIDELRLEIARLLKAAEIFGISIDGIEKIVDEMKDKRVSESSP